MPEAMDSNNQQLDTNHVLTDDELAARGMIKIQAYARDSTAKSDNAIRAKRAREKSQASGAGQLNVIVPVVAHETLRRIAKDLQHGAELSEILKIELVKELRIVNPHATIEISTNEGHQGAKPAGLKRLLAGWKEWFTSLFKLHVPST